MLSMSKRWLKISRRPLHQIGWGKNLGRQRRTQVCLKEEKMHSIVSAVWDHPQVASRSSKL